MWAAQHLQAMALSAPVCHTPSPSAWPARAGRRLLRRRAAPPQPHPRSRAQAGQRARRRVVHARAQMDQLLAVVFRIGSG